MGPDIGVAILAAYQQSRAQRNAISVDTPTIPTKKDSGIGYDSVRHIQGTKLHTAVDAPEMP